MCKEAPGGGSEIFRVYCNGVCVGSIMLHAERVRTVPRWGWNVTGVSPARHGSSLTYEEAKAAFAGAWREWLDLAGLTEKEAAQRVK